MKTLLPASILFGLCAVMIMGSAAAQTPPTVETTYPGLAFGALCQATLGDLPEGVLMKASDMEITAQALKDRIAQVSEKARPQFEKDAFYALEQASTKDLIAKEAKARVNEKDTASNMTDEDMVNAFLQAIAAQAQATEDEIKAFYEENADSFGAATLDQVRDQIKPYVLREKRQIVVDQYIRTMGARTPITVSAAWVKEQAAAALNNPVNNARHSGLPSMVDFGADGCKPCEMMTPIIESLKTKYSGKANILFVHVREEPILGSRYGIRSIPVQAFFDKDGKEVFRHVGFFPQDQIEKKLAELGVK